MGIYQDMEHHYDAIASKSELLLMCQIIFNSAIWQDACSNDSSSVFLTWDFSELLSQKYTTEKINYTAYFPN